MKPKKNCTFCYKIKLTSTCKLEKKQNPFVITRSVVVKDDNLISFVTIQKKYPQFQSHKIPTI